MPYLTKHQLYGPLPPITKTIQVRRTRHARHCWRSRDELIRDVLLWTPTYGRAKAGRPARTYIQQLFEDTGRSPEDLPDAMNNRGKWRERARDIRASGTTWWWYLYSTKTKKNQLIIQLYFKPAKLRAQIGISVLAARHDDDDDDEEEDFLVIQESHFFRKGIIQTFVHMSFGVLFTFRVA